MSIAADTYHPPYRNLHLSTRLNKITIEQMGEAYVSPDVNRGLQQCGYSNFSYEDCDEERYKNMLGKIEAQRWANAMFIPKYDFANPDCLIFKGKPNIVSKLAQPRVENEDEDHVEKLVINIRETKNLKYPIIAVWVDGNIYIVAGWHRAAALFQLRMKAPLILVTDGSRNQRISLLCDLANLSNAESANDVKTDKLKDICQGAEGFFTTVNMVDLSNPAGQDPTRFDFKKKLEKFKGDISMLESVRREIMHHFLREFKSTYYGGLKNERARDSKVTELLNLIFSGETHPQLFNYKKKDEKVEKNEKVITIQSHIDSTLSALGLSKFEPSTNEGHKLFTKGEPPRLFSYQMERHKKQCLNQQDPQFLKNQGPMTLCKISEMTKFDSRLSEITAAVDHFTAYNKGHSHHGCRCRLWIDGRFQDVPNPTVNRLIFPQRFNDTRDRCFVFIWNDSQNCFEPQNGPLPKTAREKKLQREQKAEIAALEALELEDWEV